ncbi:hypothetical protein RvY_07447-2 [Ramazzottius varieornatus]|uniref:Nitrate/nitrite sensing protein domain-containing protein n=1 Tax=Ramazzottius varieornatus TaxID=947166 RepID=A0A1D1V5B8_RAMVA|nr:hypothetical protein RvY_07447-2 [Ramazzottius varieornatus]
MVRGHASPRGQSTAQSSLSVGHATAREFLQLVQDSPSIRKKRFLKLVLVLCVPMTVLFFQCGLIMYTALNAKQIAKSTAAAVAASVQVGEVVTRLQRERGMTRCVPLLGCFISTRNIYHSSCCSLFLSSNNNVTWNNLIKLRASTEQGISAVNLWPGKPDDVEWLSTSANFRNRLLRHRIDRKSNHTSIEEVVWYTRLIEGALKLMNRDVKLSGDIGGELWKNLFALELFTNTKEAFGIQRALGSAYFSKGYSTPDEHDMFFDVYVKSKTFFEICFDHSEDSRSLYKKILTGKENLTSLLFERMRPIILANVPQSADVARGLVQKIIGPTKENHSDNSIRSYYF